MGLPLPKEGDLIKSCLQLLSLRGCFAWRNNVTGVYDPVRKVFRTFQGLKGVSDVLGVLPGGRFIAVETKMAGNEPTLDQQLFLSNVQAHGGLAVVAYDVRELEAALADALQQ
jgi:hypothetical protein